MFVYDVLLCTSLAQCLLVSDCMIERDYPLYCYVSDTLFLYENTPHHLIILLSSCILHVFPMTNVFLTCFIFCIPLMIKHHFNTHRSLIRHL
jgi:hypothetical protein